MRKYKQTMDSCIGLKVFNNGPTPTKFPRICCFKGLAQTKVDR